MYYDWYGQFWTRWGDAVREAGLEPSRMSKAYDDVFADKRKGGEWFSLTTADVRAFKKWRKIC